MQPKYFREDELGVALGGEGFRPLSSIEIAELVKKGMPGPEEGMYNAEACLHWYVGVLRSDFHARGIFVPGEFAVDGDPVPCRPFLLRRPSDAD